MKNSVSQIVRILHIYKIAAGWEILKVWLWDLKVIKGIVSSKMNILSSFTYPHVVPNLTLWGTQMLFRKCKKHSSKYLVLCSSELQVWNDMRVSKWWQNVHYLVNCSFKCCSCSSTEEVNGNRLSTRDFRCCLWLTINTLRETAECHPRTPLWQQPGGSDVINRGRCCHPL